ncbi:MAG: hypothetical protein ACR2PH_14850 [Desulfobulbia bacterium]
MAVEKSLFVEEISAIFVEHNIFTSEEIKTIQEEFDDSPKELFADFLLEQGLINQDDLLEMLSKYYSAPLFDVTGHFFDTFLLHKFPKDFLLRNAVIPLELDENILIVVASNPDVGLASKMREHVSYDIRFLVGLHRDICDGVKEYYSESLTEVVEDEDIRRTHLEEVDALSRGVETEDLEGIPGDDEWD